MPVVHKRCEGVWRFFLVILIGLQGHLILSLKFWLILTQTPIKIHVCSFETVVEDAHGRCIFKDDTLLIFCFRNIRECSLAPILLLGTFTGRVQPRECSLAFLNQFESADHCCKLVGDAYFSAEVVACLCLDNPLLHSLKAPRCTSILSVWQENLVKMNGLDLRQRSIRLFGAFKHVDKPRDVWNAFRMRLNNL